MDFYLGGYFLTQGTFGNNLFGNELLHPKDLVLSWVKSDINDQKEYCHQLSLTEDGFLKMQLELDDLFDKKKYGWLSVFLDVNEARRFAKSFLKEINNLKLVGVGTSEQYKEKFLKMHKPTQNEGASGVYLCLELEQIIPFPHKLIGFAILEFAFGYFRSDLDNNFKKRCSNELKIEWNKYGLLDSWDDACRVNDYLYAPSSKVVWQPWIIFEIDLESGLNA
jgi:hypothetical protein